MKSLSRNDLILQGIRKCFTLAICEITLKAHIILSHKSNIEAINCIMIIHDDVFSI